MKFEIRGKEKPKQKTVFDLIKGPHGCIDLVASNPEVEGGYIYTLLKILPSGTSVLMKGVSEKLGLKINDHKALDVVAF